MMINLEFVSKDLLIGRGFGHLLAAELAAKISPGAGGSQCRQATVLDRGGDL